MEEYTLIDIAVNLRRKGKWTTVYYTIRRETLIKDEFNNGEVAFITKGGKLKRFKHVCGIFALEEL